MIGKAQGIRRPDCGSSLANAQRAMEPRQARTRALDDPERGWTIPEQIAGMLAGTGTRGALAGAPAQPMAACQGEVCWESPDHRQAKEAVEQARSPSVQPRGR